MDEAGEGYARKKLRFDGKEENMPLSLPPPSTPPYQTRLIGRELSDRGWMHRKASGPPHHHYLHSLGTIYRQFHLASSRPDFSLSLSFSFFPPTYRIPLRLVTHFCNLLPFYSGTLRMAMVTRGSSSIGITRLSFHRRKLNIIVKLTSSRFPFILLRHRQFRSSNAQFC